MKFDPYFDFQKEADYRDSDRWSPTLQAYHQHLWSKPLPAGDTFKLELATQNRLRHSRGDLDYYLSSDRAVATWRKKPKLLEMLSSSQRETHTRFIPHSDTMGGITIWPSQKIDNKITINGHRGFSSYIADRLDLTLECVRRHYAAEQSPLGETFKRYGFFFDLFVDFEGYVEFFGFDDWVVLDKSAVLIATDFDGFQTNGYPKSSSEFVEYMTRTSELITARNERLRAFA